MRPSAPACSRMSLRHLIALSDGGGARSAAAVRVALRNRVLRPDEDGSPRAARVATVSGQPQSGVHYVAERKSGLLCASRSPMHLTEEWKRDYCQRAHGTQC